MKLFYKLLMLLLLFTQSCKYDTTTADNTSIVGDTTINDTTTNIILTTTKKESVFKQCIKWVANLPEPHWGTEVWFEYEDSVVVFLYTMQCVSVHKAEYKLEADTPIINLYWKHEYGCKYQTTIDSSYGLGKNAPQKGKLFAQIKQLNDTILSINYLYPKWVEKINKFEQHHPLTDLSRDMFPRELKMNEYHRKK